MENNEILKEAEKCSLRRMEILNKIYDDLELKKVVGLLKEIFNLPEAERINLYLFLLERKEAQLSPYVLRREYAFEDTTDVLIDRFDDLADISKYNIEYFLRQEIIDSLETAGLEDTVLGYGVTGVYRLN